MSKRTRLVITPLVIAAVWACGGDDTLAGPDGRDSPSNVVGTYVLRSLDGDGNPIILYQDEFYRFSLTETLRIRAEGDYLIRTTMITTLDDEVSYTYEVYKHGIWSLSGSRLSLVPSDVGCVETAMISADRLTIAKGCEDGLQRIYETRSSGI